MNAVGALSGDLTDGALLDWGSLLDHFMQRALVDQPLGNYRLTCLLRPDPDSDFEKISEHEWLLLPLLRVEHHDVEMVEDKEYTISVLCDGEFLADDDDQPQSVQAVEMTPSAHFDSQARRLDPQPHRRLVRLLYPPAKVELSFTPRLFAYRLAQSGVIIPAEGLTYRRAKETTLHLLAPSPGVARIEIHDKSVNIPVGEDGRAAFALSQLLEYIRDETTTIAVAWGEERLNFSLRWQPTARFEPGQTSLERLAADGYRLLASLQASGPPATELRLRVSPASRRS